MSVRVNGSDFRHSLEDLAIAVDRIATDALAAAVQETEQHANATSLYKDQTRELRASTQGTVDKAGMRAVVTNKAKHAVFVHEGTKAHAIVARNATFLRFEVGGSVVFRRRVWHPGTKPRPFLRIAGEHGTTALERALHDGLNQAIHGA